MAKSGGASFGKVSQNFELVVDWEEKLVPYLESAGAQSVAVVSPHHLIVDQLVFGGAFGVPVVVKICLIMSESSLESNKIPKQVGTCFGSYLGVHMSAR